MIEFFMSVLNCGSFNKSFFENNKEIKWFGGGILFLENGLIATIKNATHGTSEGYEVEVKSKDNIIDKHYFPFNAYSGEENTLVDGKMVGTKANNYKTCLMKWYDKVPEYRKINEMAKEIVNYINEFAKIQ
jgi:hypothetical protein